MAGNPHQQVAGRRNRPTYLLRLLSLSIGETLSNTSKLGVMMPVACPNSFRYGSSSSSTSCWPQPDDLPRPSPRRHESPRHHPPLTRRCWCGRVICRSLGMLLLLTTLMLLWIGTTPISAAAACCFPLPVAFVRSSTPLRRRRTSSPPNAPHHHPTQHRFVPQQEQKGLSLNMAETETPQQQQQQDLQQQTDPFHDSSTTRNDPDPTDPPFFYSSRGDWDPSGNDEEQQMPPPLAPGVVDDPVLSMADSFVNVFASVGKLLSNIPLPKMLEQVQAGLQSTLVSSSAAAAQNDATSINNNNGQATTTSIPSQQQRTKIMSDEAKLLAVDAEWSDLKTTTTTSLPASSLEITSTAASQERQSNATEVVPDTALPDNTEKDADDELQFSSSSSSTENETNGSSLPTTTPPSATTTPSMQQQQQQQQADKVQELEIMVQQLSLALQEIRDQRPSIRVVADNSALGNASTTKEAAAARPMDATVPIESLIDQNKSPPTASAPAANRTIVFADSVATELMSPVAEYPASSTESQEQSTNIIDSISFSSEPIAVISSRSSNVASIHDTERIEPPKPTTMEPFENPSLPSADTGDAETMAATSAPWMDDAGENSNGTAIPDAVAVKESLPNVAMAKSKPIVAVEEYKPNVAVEESILSLTDASRSAIGSQAWEESFEPITAETVDTEALKSMYLAELEELTSSYLEQQDSTSTIVVAEIVTDIQDSITETIPSAQKNDTTQVVVDGANIPDLYEPLFADTDDALFEATQMENTLKALDSTTKSEVTVAFVDELPVTSFIDQNISGGSEDISLESSMRFDNDDVNEAAVGESAFDAQRSVAASDGNNEPSTVPQMIDKEGVDLGPTEEEVELFKDSLEIDPASQQAFNDNNVNVTSSLEYTVRDSNAKIDKEKVFEPIVVVAVASQLKDEPAKAKGADELFNDVSESPVVDQSTSGETEGGVLEYAQEFVLDENVFQPEIVQPPIQPEDVDVDVPNEKGQNVGQGVFGVKSPAVAFVDVSSKTPPTSLQALDIDSSVDSSNSAIADEIKSGKMNLSHEMALDSNDVTLAKEKPARVNVRDTDEEQVTEPTFAIDDSQRIENFLRSSDSNDTVGSGDKIPRTMIDNEWASREVEAGIPVSERELVLDGKLVEEVDILPPIQPPNFDDNVLNEERQTVKQTLLGLPTDSPRIAFVDVVSNSPSQVAPELGNITSLDRMSVSEMENVSTSSGTTVDSVRMELEKEERIDTFQQVNSGEGEIESQRNWGDYTTSQLRDELERRGLSKYGKKSKLIDRLKELAVVSDTSEHTSTVNPNVEESVMDWSTMKVKDLKTELESRGLSVAGKKDELVASLLKSDNERSMLMPAAVETIDQESEKIPLNKDETIGLSFDESSMDDFLLDRDYTTKDGSSIDDDDFNNIEELARAAREAVALFEASTKNRESSIEASPPLRDWSNLLISELRTEAKTRGLSISGTKIDLISSLESFDAKELKDFGDDEDFVDDSLDDFDFNFDDLDLESLGKAAREAVLLYEGDDEPSDEALWAIENEIDAEGPINYPSESILPQDSASESILLQGSTSEAESKAVIDYASWAVSQLKEELNQRGLRVTGKKVELIARLRSSDGV